MAMVGNDDAVGWGGSGGVGGTAPEGEMSAVAVALSEDERVFIQQALRQWTTSAAYKPFPFQIVGSATWDDFGKLTYRLEQAVKDSVPLTDLDWARVLFLVECSFASTLIGAGRNFATMTRFSDVEALGVLRGLQGKIGGVPRARLLFPCGGRTSTAEELEELQQWGEKALREQQGRTYPLGL